MELKQEIEQLKREKDAIILAHYYVAGEVQEVADYTGDSFYLAKVAASAKNKVIVFCGVQFMGESAKILSPEKTVYLPVPEADCPMAHMADGATIDRMRREIPDLAVVCYINSSAELKMHCDVCVTSSNALKIVRALPQKNIYFIPDDHLGSFIAARVPEKNFYYCGGHCPVHHQMSAADVLAAKAAHPGLEVLVHPECPAEVVALADYAGSTSGIIEFCQKSEHTEFIIGTERGILYELLRTCPQKKFYFMSEKLLCPDMKLVTLESVKRALLGEVAEVTVPEVTAEAARKSLTEMLRLGK